MHAVHFDDRFSSVRLFSAGARLVYEHSQNARQNVAEHCRAPHTA